MGCWAICGPSGRGRAQRRSFASTRAAPISWGCGAMDSSRSLSATSAGMTTTARAPPSRPRPMATIRKVASSGTKSAMVQPGTNKASPRRSGRDSITCMPRTCRASTLAFRGLSNLPRQAQRLRCWLQQLRGMPITALGDAPTMSTRPGFPPRPRWPRGKTSFALPTPANGPLT